MLISGLGGNCKDSLTDLLLSFPKDEIAFFTDFEDDSHIPFFEEKGFKVIKGKNELRNYYALHSKETISFIGDNYIREKQAKSLSIDGGNIVSYISSKAMVNRELCSISEYNTIIMHFANVSAGSIIDEGAIIYAYTAIAHDVHIGKYVFISAHCAISNSKVGAYTFVGLNSMIGPGVEVGKNCIIGANSYVKSDLPDGVVAVGSPARIIGENKNIAK